MYEWTVLSKQGRWREALDTLSLIDVSSVHRSQRVWFENNLAWTHLQLGNASRAIVLAEHALAGVKPTARIAFAIRDTLAAALEAAGRSEEARSVRGGQRNSEI
jgi:hypothetical protein